MPETPAGPTGPGAVLLELGPGTGALVVYVPDPLLGEEITIYRRGDTWHTHAYARLRQLPGGDRTAALLDQLPAGHYEVGTQRRPVEVAAGRVATVDLAAAPN